MLKELFNRIDAKRNIAIETTEYGVYSERKTEAIYNDSKQQYETNHRNGRNLKVSSVKSFIDFITEELKRLNNATGKNTTVVIDEDGGSFSADDDFMKIGCNYSRSLTSGWQTLQNVANQKLNHEQLLTTLQKLRPFILNFEELYKRLLDIRTIGRSEMISNPVFIQGEENGSNAVPRSASDKSSCGGLLASSGYKVTFKLQSGEQDEVELPNSFRVILPYAKGRQDVTYVIPVELMYLNNGNGRIEILFQCSELERIEEEALEDEVIFLKEQLTDFSELLVLLNY